MWVLLECFSFVLIGTFWSECYLGTVRVFAFGIFHWARIKCLLFAVLVALVASSPWPVPSVLLGRVPLCARVPLSIMCAALCPWVPWLSLCTCASTQQPCLPSAWRQWLLAFMSWVVQVQNVRFYFRYLKTALSISYLALKAKVTFSLRASVVAVSN